MTEEEILLWTLAAYARHFAGVRMPEIRVGTYKGDSSAAIFSPCGRYRYGLVRIWDQTKPKWLFAMLNPSTASECDGDNTVDRQVNRVKALDGGGIIVINAGGLVETNRKKAIGHPDPIGPENEALARPLVEEADHIVVAYGADAIKFGGDRLLARVLSGREVMALRKTKKGFPGHPLYISYATTPQPFTMPAY
ncbi:DUF1643 domain-containing protein [Sphingomonas parva]|uniref:DUF1643 domain-containing protein n=1 Tax=Sphingomonas parva TaxID=2555898 RepID=A0A4Y8ZRI5_9SPHN|nr:DUF1643 domain-containing protein [Sphingomonas parva]TFI58623.1 DUF1643 domain-containing protein [Sphingomonas parva]